MPTCLKSTVRIHALPSTHQIKPRNSDSVAVDLEVDFVVAVNGRILPLEVKSGASGRLRSLHLLLETYPSCATGYVFSCAPYSELPDQRLVFLPLYYAWSINHF